MSTNLAEGLRAGIQALGLDLSAEQQQRLLDYMALIQKWTKVYNLTAVRDPAEMLTHHLLDSLTAIAPLTRHTLGQSIRVLDVGSGGGLPGVVLAICMPELNVTCVDTVAKKAAFVQQVAVSLRLPNLRGLHARVETLTDPYQVICSRAFASLPDFVTWSRSALVEGGVWMAMKGKHPQDEVDALPQDVKVFHVEPLTVPGLDVERCMIWMRLNIGVA
ncbi:16S rRNA (guanine(527)-N(7))-methyltransferase RsmG [Limnohabitans sp. Jir72]|uniref:16S rRNA (guanine(527)-N(7))-methyltransferase RsmG n=1 Tax=Limnohabitans sp. Jir72 TaxID=1977909 RepID=UPI000D37EB22|nr:16S rRNA (guanine(527)-N(7))-methyltransferase RsmG [Limnohabitans sp. Jir72]PUE33486.1 16S rRNA (guanine(527)-N(7))-methyltransferase RsmG [Limnohabitans sp. Jir72]